MVIKLKKYCSLIFHLVAIAVLLLPFSFNNSILNSQDPVSTQNIERRELKWIRQIPAENEYLEQSFGQKVNDLIFGRKPTQIIKPISSIKDNKGNIWILNQGNGTILKIHKNKKRIVSEIINKNDTYPSLISICEIPGKGVVFTDSYQNKIFFIDENEKKIRDFNSLDSLKKPTGITYSAKTDQIWVVETGAHRISTFSSEGSLIKTIGSRGTEPGQFNFPTHIWIDNAGIAYVVDAMNFRVQLFDENGKFISSFGEAGNVSGTIARPKGIATDSKGNIYIADALFNSVQIFDQDGSFLSYFGTQGNGMQQFWMPSGIYIDDMDYIYISDSYNNRVQIYQSVNNTKTNE